MNTKNNTKSLAILAALVAVVGLGVGFAALTRSLTINTSAAVNGKTLWSDLVTFNTSDSTTCTKSTNATVIKGTVSGTAITGFQATLKAPGDWAECTYVVQNASAYTSYLRSVAFSNKSTCTAGTGTTGLVNSACSYIQTTVQVGGTAYNATCPSGAVCVTNNSSTLGSNTTVSSHPLAAKSGSTNGTEKVFVHVEYKSGGDLVDGTFTVLPAGTNGTINLTYSTVDKAS